MVEEEEEDDNEGAAAWPPVSDGAGPGERHLQWRRRRGRVGAASCGEAVALCGHLGASHDGAARRSGTVAVDEFENGDRRAESIVF